MLQDYSNSIVIHIPYCLCIVIERRGEFPKKGKKIVSLKIVVNSVIGSFYVPNYLKQFIITCDASLCRAYAKLHT